MLYPGVAWGGLVLVVLVGLWFARRQNRARALGGRISRAKQIWLIWAVYTWFVLSPVLAKAPLLGPGARLVLGAFSAFMALRGVVEVIMLYVTKNWRPPYGVAHDVACVLLVASGLVWVVWSGEDTSSPLASWGPAVLGGLVVSLVLETYYAVAFHHAVEGKTTGDDGVWFASADEARFRCVNRVTAVANVPLVAGVLALLVVMTRAS